jgi:hypothetical protein
MPLVRSRLVAGLLAGLFLLCAIHRAVASELGAPGAGLAWLKAAKPMPIGAEASMPPIRFDLNETAPDEPARRVLQAFGRMLALAGSEGFELTLEGHTDDAGTDELNQALSLARARSVAALIQSGLPAGRSLAKLTVTGKGSDEPLLALPGSDPAHRRVEIGLRRLELTHTGPADWAAVYGAPTAAERLRFDGTGTGRSFPLLDERLASQVRGGVDFWLSPEWNQALEYDPTVLSLTDGLGPRYSLHIITRSGWPRPLGRLEVRLLFRPL